MISVKTLIPICRLRVNHTHISYWRKSFFKRPKDSFPVTPCPSKVMVKEEISAAFYNPYTVYWNGSSLNSSVRKSCGGLKMAHEFLKRDVRGPRASSPLFTVEMPQIKKHFFPSNAFLMLASGMMDVHRQVGGSFVDQSRLSCFLPSLSTSG